VVTGDVTASHEARTPDSNIGGARLEHTGILRPGSRCGLRLSFEQKAVMVIGCPVGSKMLGRVQEIDPEAGVTMVTAVNKEETGR
jgi:hypothetical protein